jgi:hypothetical protein
VAADPGFDELRPEIARLKSRLDDKSVSLNEAQRRRERADEKAFAKAIAAKAEAEEAAVPVYEITVKTAGLPGLPPRLASRDKPESATAASHAGADVDAAETAGARAADGLVLDESLRILADYVGLLARPAGSGGAGGHRALAESRDVRPRG